MVSAELFLEKSVDTKEKDSRNLSPITEADVAEINRISNNKSVRKLSAAIKKDLDKEMLSKMMAGYLVLKANGHPDSDFVRYLTRKETGSTLKLGFKMATAMAPSLLTDSEFRSLVRETRKQMKKEKQSREKKQREAQQQLEELPKNKIGPVTVRIKSDEVS